MPATSHPKRALLAPACAVVVLGLAGCAATQSALTTPPVSGASATPPSAAATASLSNETIIPVGNAPTVDVSAVTLYTRVASGALKCWFGGYGPLRKAYVFNGDAAPPSAGGAAEITLHERDALAAQTAGLSASRGLRAYRLIMTPVAEEKARLTLEPGKLPPDLAAAIEADALAYAFGLESCRVQEVRPPPPPPEPPATKRKLTPKTASTPKR